MKKKQRITAYVGDEVYREARIRAAVEGVSISTYVTRLILEDLELEAGA